MNDLRATMRGKFDGYRRWLAHEHYMWSSRRINERNRRNYERWIKKLRTNPPEVIVGADLASGGVRHHIRAIKRYSTLRLELAPPEELINAFSGELRESFAEFLPPGLKAVHSHVIPWFIKWCAKKQKTGIRWIHTYHLNYFPEHAKGELLPWQKEINETLLYDAPHADVRISVARWQQEDLKTRHGIDTVYLPNGVDVSVCDQGDPKRFRKKAGEAPFVLYAGRNDPVKNPADFVRLAQRLPKWQFVMIGHELNRETLQKEWDVEVPLNLKIYGGASHLETQDALAACSALVVTSKREGLPTLVLEAMAHGKPIVVPNEAGCLEAIANGEFGHIYEQGKIDDLAGKLESALGDHNNRSAARERVLSEYDWRVVAPKLDAIYCG